MSNLPPPIPPPEAPRPLSAPLSSRQEKYKPIRIALVSCVLLATGSCAGFLTTIAGNSSWQSVGIVLGGIFVLAALGAVVSLIWLVVVWLINLSR